MNKVLLTITCLLIGFGVFAQTTDKKYEPSHEQMLELQVRQKSAQLAQFAVQQAQVNFNNALVELTHEADKIKKDNKWSDSVFFDANAVTFCDKPNNGPQGPQCAPVPPPPAK